MNASADLQGPLASPRCGLMQSATLPYVALGQNCLNVPCALLGGPDGLRQNCRTTDGEVACRDMRLQTGENVSSAGLDACAQRLDIRRAIPLRGEQP